MALFVLALAVSTMALVTTAQTARAASVTPTQVSGNPTCKTLLSPGPSYEIKVDPPTSGTYGPLTVTFSPDGKLVDFTSTVKVLGVFVKGGTDGGNFYDYRPLGGSLGDTGLKLPTNQQISHVSFCWDEEPTPPDDALEVSKTADATYDRKIDWKLEKSVDPASHSGEAGDSFDSNWNVKATKDESLSNYKVTGKITITNPNDQAVGFSVTDKLDDGTMADVDCNTTVAGNQATGTVPANSTVYCGYVANPTSKAATSNNVQVSSTTDGVPGDSALAPVNWNENVQGDEKVTLADPRFDDFSKEITTSTTETFPETFDCSSDPNDYTDGKYSYTEKNTATLTGQSTNLSDDADVKVDCVLPALTASKTAAGTYDRKVDWKLEKTVDDNSHSGNAGQAAGSSDWSVKATKTAVENNFNVTGKITVNNPSSIAQTFNVNDTLDDLTMATVDCDLNAPGAQTSGSVDAGKSLECDYTATPTTKNAKLNTATVSAPGNKDVVATADVTYTPKVTGDETVKLADPRFNYEQEISTTTPKVFPETFNCSSDPNDYTDGKYSYKETNTATLKGVTTNLSANADVNVDCTLAALTASKTANGSYDRTIKWDLSKTVTPQSTFSGKAGDSFNYTWNVGATKSVVENNYKVTGEITITNPAAVSQTFDVTDELDKPAGTKASVDCNSDFDGDQSSATVPANSTFVCTYTASTATATLNTATVKAAGNSDVKATAPVSYTAKVIGDEQVTLADPLLSYSKLISDNTSETFPKTFTCPTDPTNYTNYTFTKSITNVATLTGPNTKLSKDATVKFTCTYPWRSETATGAGIRYPGTSNWFMYTGYNTTKVDLIAGQNYDAGDIYMTRSGGNTYIKVTLASGFRWANASQNLKIQDFAKAPTKYVQPGNFKYKFTVTPQSTVTYTAKIPGDTAKFYGIHADVERYVP